MSTRPSFFSELKRRNVYKVGAMYGVAGWLLVQVATQVFPFFDIPNWVVRVVVIAIVAGFPLALVLSWIYELTPQGIVKTDEVASDASITSQTGQKLNRAIIAVLVMGARLLWPQQEPQAGAGATGKSIAVLPFDNLSDDKSNAYFAEGIQDEILTRLSKIAALKVISRTSTQKYKSAPDNLRDVGQQLGVANLLEGSVQKIANAVHINVQLIRAANDEHLWAESYNRKLDDVFGVEGEVATTIADQLNAKLTGAEKRELNARPTNNPEAYDAYLRGSAEHWQTSEASLTAAIHSFEEAVQLDPQFAQASASLSRAHSLMFFHYDKTPSRQA